MHDLESEHSPEHGGQTRRCADPLCAGEKASDFDNGLNAVLRGLLTCDFKHLKC